MGSMDAARRAGMKAAIRPVIVAITETSTNTTGLRDPVPYSMLLSTEPDSSDASSPIATPIAISTPALAHNSVQHLAALRSKRHANANLPCTLRDRVRHHTIKADNGKRDGESGFHSKVVSGPGFRTDHLVMMSFDPELARYKD